MQWDWRCSLVLFTSSVSCAWEPCLAKTRSQKIYGPEFFMDVVQIWSKATGNKCLRLLLQKVVIVISYLFYSVCLMDVFHKDMKDHSCAFSAYIMFVDILDFSNKQITFYDQCMQKTRKSQKAPLVYLNVVRFLTCLTTCWHFDVSY